MIEINLPNDLSIARSNILENSLSKDYGIGYLSKVYSLLKGLALYSRVPLILSPYEPCCVMLLVKTKPERKPGAQS